MLLVACGLLLDVDCMMRCLVSCCLCNVCGLSLLVVGCVLLSFGDPSLVLVALCGLLCGALRLLIVVCCYVLLLRYG